MNTLVSRMLAICLATAVVTQYLTPTAKAAEAVLIRAQYMHTMSGEPLENVEVLVRDGRIVGIGETIRPQGTFQVLEVHTLMPGLVDAYSSLGLRGGDSESTREVTPEFDTATTIDWRSRDFSEAIQSGITTANIMPGTDNVIAGFACLAKTAGSDFSLDADNSRLVKTRTGLAMAICSDPTSGNRSRSRPDSIYVRQPTNRMGVVWIVRSRLQQAAQAIAAGGGLDDITTRFSEMLTGDMKAFGISRTSYDIETLITLGDEFGFAPILFGGHEAYKTIDLLVERQTPVVYTASPAQATVGEERTDLFWNTPGKLDAAGVSVTLAGGDLLNRARFAKRFGMDADSALAAITSRPAELLGVGNRLGRIAAEYDADLIALNGPPLEFTSKIEWVMVDGQVLNSDDGE